MVTKLSEYIESTAVAIDDTLDLGVLGRNGSGQIFFGDVGGDINIIFQSDGTFKTVGDFSGFEVGIAKKDNAGTVNIYTESGNIIIQNKTAAEIKVANTIRSILS